MLIQTPHLTDIQVLEFVARAQPSQVIHAKRRTLPAAKQRI